MRPQTLLAPFAAFLISFLAFAGGSALADPPSQAPRLGYITGEVSFQPAGDRNWARARINRPLTIGDRLWTDRGARAEIQLAGAVIRMGENTSLKFLNLTDTLIQIQVDDGTISLRVRSLGPRQAIEVATPNLAFTARQAGRYRIDVDGSADTTEIVVRNGRAEVYGERNSYRLDTRQAYRFGGSGLRSYEVVRTPVEAEFERWAMQRDRRFDSSASLRYVSRDVIGYEELDAHGRWYEEPGYGRVWTPTRVSANWSPYRDGHWAWVEPWGWTWVDDAPWGYAVSHYGRWAHVQNRWAWIPAPVRSRPVYSPALVAFIGAVALSSGSDRSVGWFPLGHREVYVPPYQVSRGYFDNVNRSNTNVSPATITNIYNTRNVTNVYVNQRAPSAVVAVPVAAFAQSQPVARVAVQAPQAATTAQVSAGAGVAPGQQAVRGGQPETKAEPPARALERRVVARNAPPEAPARFAPEQKDAAAKAQAPADKPATKTETKAVVVAQPDSKAPAAAPPAKAPEGAPAKAAERKADDTKAADRKDEKKADDTKAAERKADDRKMGQRGEERKADEAKAKAADGKGDDRKMGQRGDERKAEDRKPPAAIVTPAVPPVAAPKAEPAPVPAPAAKQATPAVPPVAAPKAAPAPAPAPAAKQATPAAPPVAAPKAEPAPAPAPAAKQDRKDERKADPIAAPKAAPAPVPAPAAKQEDRKDERKAEDRKPPAPVATPSTPPAAAPKAAPAPVPAPAAKQDDRKRDEARERAEAKAERRAEKAEKAAEKAEKAAEKKAAAEKAAAEKKRAEDEKK